MRTMGPEHFSGGPERRVRGRPNHPTLGRRHGHDPCL